MKQFNIHDETHLLGRKLSLETGKSLLVVVKEALELYQRRLGGTVNEDDAFFQKAMNTLTRLVCEVIHEEVPKVVTKVRELQEEARVEHIHELEDLIAEAEVRNETDV